MTRLREYLEELNTLTHMQTNTTHTKLYYFQSFSKAGRESLNNRFFFPLSLSENVTKKCSSYTLEVSLMNDSKYLGGSGEEHGGRAVIGGRREFKAILDLLGRPGGI